MPTSVDAIICLIKEKNVCIEMISRVKYFLAQQSLRCLQILMSLHEIHLTANLKLWVEALKN